MEAPSQHAHCGSADGAGRLTVKQADIIPGLLQLAVKPLHQTVLGIPQSNRAQQGPQHGIPEGCQQAPKVPKDHAHYQHKCQPTGMQDHLQGARQFNPFAA